MGKREIEYCDKCFREFEENPFLFETEAFCNVDCAIEYHKFRHKLRMKSLREKKREK